MDYISLSEVNKEVILKDNGELYFGQFKVYPQQDRLYTKSTIPTKFLVRAIDDTGYPSIVAGLDLIKDGKMWLAGCRIKMWVNQEQMHLPSAFYERFDSIIYILNNLCADTIGKSWGIYEEEDWDDYK